MSPMLLDLLTTRNADLGSENFEYQHTAFLCKKHWQNLPDSPQYVQNVVHKSHRMQESRII